MSTKYQFRALGVAVVALLLIATSFGFARDVFDAVSPDLVRDYGVQSRRPITLDEDYTQFRYLKTTDFGATWTGPVQAGDISTVNLTSSSLPDFKAVVTATNEIVYVCYFQYATTPGVYAIPGPSFTPVLVMAEGDNNLHTAGGDGGDNGRGWAQIGKTPNGDLWMIIWGVNAQGNVTVWASRSGNNGLAWTAPWVVASAPSGLPATAQHFQISEMNDEDWIFAQFQDENWEQYVLRFPTTTGGTGTYVDLGADAGSAVSYYIGQCKPIAFDPVANALLVCFRGSDLTFTGVFYSSNLGVSFQTMSVPGAQRYPSLAMNRTAGTPFVISNFGVPSAGGLHVSWFSYDELGYGGGSWTAPDTISAIVATEGSGGPLLYVNQAIFWDATHAMAMHNLWGTYTPEGLYTSRSVDGGMTWGEFSQRWQYEANQFDATTISQQSILQGSNGVGYIYFAARTGITDVTGPGFSNVNLLTPATGLGPYTLSATLTDNNVDPTDNHISFWIPAACADARDTLLSDSSVITDPGSNSGTYYFHIPTSICGHTIASGDSVFFYFWGRDLGGNAGGSDTMIIRAGFEFLDVDRHIPASVEAFDLRGNYPNPFNPTTRIAFDLPGAYRVSLKVFNTLGQQVAVVSDNELMVQGHHELAFDGTGLPSGVYFYTLNAGPYTSTKKMVLMK